MAASGLFRQPKGIPSLPWLALPPVKSQWFCPGYDSCKKNTFAVSISYLTAKVDKGKGKGFAPSPPLGGGVGERRLSNSTTPLRLAT